MTSQSLKLGKSRQPKGNSGQSICDKPTGVTTKEVTVGRTIEETQTREVRLHRGKTRVTAAPSKLRITPYAREKLFHAMLRMGNNEIGFLGVSSPEDLLLIQDLIIMKQCVNEVINRPDKTWLADTMCELSDPEGEYQLDINQFMRVWVHTHPGMSPQPSVRDIEAFTHPAHFGGADWGVMLIVTSPDEYYCRYRIQDVTGKNIFSEMKLETSIGANFPAISETERESWDAEILEKVKEIIPDAPLKNAGVRSYRLASNPTPPNSSWLESSLLDEFGFGDFDFESKPPNKPLSGKGTKKFLNTVFACPRSSFFYQMDDESLLDLLEWQDEDILAEEVKASMIFALRELDIEIDGTSPEGFAVFTVPLKKAAPMKLTSTELIALDRHVCNNAAAAEQLRQAEEYLIEEYGASERDPSGAFTVYDGWGDPIDVLQHWVCHDGGVIFICNEEKLLLTEIGDGGRQTDQTAFGFEPENVDVEDTPSSVKPCELESSKVISAWEDCIAVCRKYLDEGAPVLEIEEAFDRTRATIAVKENYANEFDHVLIFLRNAGYDPAGVDMIRMLEDCKDVSSMAVSQALAGVS